VGALLLAGGVLGMFVYGWLVFLTRWSLLVLKLTGFIAIAAVLGIVSWIGYTLATTPSPKPVEEIEKEIEELEEESKEQA